MPTTHSFRAKIEDSGGSGAYVTVPFDVEAAFGKKRVKVKAAIDGVPYRGSLVRMGGDCHVLGVLKEIRQQIGKTIGDEVEITLEEDVEPRQVTLAADVQQALAGDRAAQSAFDKLSYSHQREYALWIEEARRSETRRKRLVKMLEMLKQGKAAH